MRRLFSVNDKAPLTAFVRVRIPPVPLVNNFVRSIEMSEHEFDGEFLENSMMEVLEEQVREDYGLPTCEELLELGFPVETISAEGVCLRDFTKKKGSK